MPTFSYGSYNFSPKSTGMAFGQPRGAFGTQALPQQPAQPVGQSPYSPAARPQQPAPQQQQQPAQQPPQQQQPSALSSYLQQYRGQPNYFEGTPPPAPTAPATQTPPPQSALQQQLAQPSPAAGLDVHAANDWSQFQQWMKQNRPEAYYQHQNEYKRLADDAIRKSYGGGRSGMAEAAGANKAMIQWARQAGYQGVDPALNFPWAGAVRG